MKNVFQVIVILCLSERSQPQTWHEERRREVLEKNEVNIELKFLKMSGFMTL